MKLRNAILITKYGGLETNSRGRKFRGSSIKKIINDNSAAAANWLKFDASKPAAHSFRFVVKYFRRTVIVIR